VAVYYGRWKSRRRKFIRRIVGRIAPVTFNGTAGCRAVDRPRVPAIRCNFGPLRSFSKSSVVAGRGGEGSNPGAQQPAPATRPHDDDEFIARTGDVSMQRPTDNLRPHLDAIRQVVTRGTDAAAVKARKSSSLMPFSAPYSTAHSTQRSARRIAFQTPQPSNSQFSRRPTSST